MAPKALPLRREREQARVADEVDALAVGDDGVEGAAVRAPEELARPRADGGGRLAERRVEDHVADDDRPTRDLALGLLGPALRAGLRVQRVELAVVGADVDGRLAVGDV